MLAVIDERHAIEETVHALQDVPLDLWQECFAAPVIGQAQAADEALPGRKTYLRIGTESAGQLFDQCGREAGGIPEFATPGEAERQGGHECAERGE